MALTRPTLLQVPAFDATQQYVFTFVVQGIGSQVVANQLVIREQDTNQIVYTEKQETFSYKHILNADELTNGVYYNAVLSVFDASDNESPTSIPIQFYCYSTPTIEFTNLPVNNVILNASFNFEFTYNQSQGELLNSYVVNLYNNFGTQIQTSGTQYVLNGTPPYIASYQINGLDNASEYSIEVIGQTINNTVVSTDKVDFTVEYKRPDIFTLLQLTNNCEEGYISIKSNIVVIEGESNPDPPIYINDSEVDLTNPDHWVEWNDGYVINGDFIARLWFRKPNPYSQILKFSNNQGQDITVYYMLGYEDINSSELQSYIEIYVNSIEGMEYYIYSNFIDTLPDNEYYCLWLTRIGQVYQLQLAKV